MSGTPRTAWPAIRAEQQRTAPAPARHEALGRRSGWYYIGPVLLIFATFATSRRRELSDLLEGSMDMEVQIKLAIWALLGLIALRRLPIILRNSHLLFTLPVAPYVAFCLLALVSTVYSAQPSLSGVRSLQLLVVIALGLSMIDRVHEWPKLAALYLGINWAFLLIGLSGLVPALHWRELPGFQEEGYDGITGSWRFGTPIGHFSIISLVAAMLAVAQVARMRRACTLGDVLMLVWAVATVLLTVSRTGVIALVLGVGTVLLLRGAMPVVTLVLGGVGSLTLLVPGLLGTVEDFLRRGQDAEELASLTGRAGIYDSALALIGDNWLFGHGFRASRAAQLTPLQDHTLAALPMAAHAHNAVLESVASLGLAGAACAVTILLSLVFCGLAVLRRPPQRPDAAGDEDGGRDGRTQPAVEYFAYSPPIFAFSLMDSSFAVDINPFVFFFIAIILDFTRYRALYFVRPPTGITGGTVHEGVHRP